MKRYVVGMVMVLALATVSSGASAQLVPPGYGQNSGQMCGARVGTLSLYGGWVTDARTTRYETVRPLEGVFTVAVAKYDYDYRSFVMGANLPICLGNLGVISLSGSWSIPATSLGRELLLRPNLRIRGNRRWHAKTSWGTAEAMWAYTLTENYSTLVGFRWDNWQTSYRSPIIEVPQRGNLYLPTDAGNFTVNSYIPLVGLMATYRGLRLGAMGFPGLSGQAMQHMIYANGVLRGTADLGRAYFCEIFIDYSLHATDLLQQGLDGDMSVFGKMNVLSANGIAANRWWYTSGQFAGEDDWDFNFRRALFMVGAKATLHFSIPDFGDLI